MIVYNKTKKDFVSDVLSNDIDSIIFNLFKEHLSKGVGERERKSWRESLSAMDRLLNTPDIPNDCGIAIEYQISQTSKRVDFIVSGKNAKEEDQIVLIELKAWNEAQLTNKDAIVKTYVGGGLREVTHPSYQAWSYATLLDSFNEFVYTNHIPLNPCAYLHNYSPDNVIQNPFYHTYLEKAPVFLKNDALKLREYIKSFIKTGDNGSLIKRVDKSPIKPSKTLADCVGKMLQNNKEFIMIDDQKVVFETAMKMCKLASDTSKKVLIVEGGPGTGKSVVAINLLVELTKRGLLSQYVSKNAAPRAVYASKLAGVKKQREIKNLFSGSGAFMDTKSNIFSALIVDEAHRLNEKSGLYGNAGENQIKEIINASRFSVFFIDNKQRVTLKDIGEAGAIKKWANDFSAEVEVRKLDSQFRCNGSDGYLSWLDHVLYGEKTANETLKDIDYDFKIFDDPTRLREVIFEKNKINNKARLVAGYCWNWKSKSNHKLYDIEFPEFGFKMKWNLATDGSLWVIAPNSVNEIGCIHTIQGLEADYVGVIIGPDLVVRNGELLTDVSKRARDDRSVYGYKNLLKSNSVDGRKILDDIIRNTYRTLMTRGMKGCYVYFSDKETARFFKENI